MNTIFMQVTTVEGATTGSIFLGSGNIHQDILLVALVVVMVTILISALMVLRAVRVMIRVVVPQTVADEATAKADAKRARRDGRIRWWNKLMGLRPMAEEKDLVIDHEYDGIKELDNPVPAWFNGMFYASLVFAVVYLCVYHVFGWGATQAEEYAQEMARAEEARQEWLSQAANNIDENTVTLDSRPETVAAGLAIFTQNCVACHGGAGEGGIGPNLADDYWLHGGEVQDVFRIIKYGVLDKGMVPWEQSLTPAQIAEVANYIVSLRGSNPPNAKEPQGEKVAYQEL